MGFCILGFGNHRPSIKPTTTRCRPMAARDEDAAVADIYDPGSVFKIVPAAGRWRSG